MPGAGRRALRPRSPRRARSAPLPAGTRSFGLPPEKSEEFEELLSERLAGSQPIGRVGRPEDIAEAAVFLASDSSSFITGVTLPVDGGATAVTQSGFAAIATQAATDFQARS